MERWPGSGRPEQRAVLGTRRTDPVDPGSAGGHARWRPERDPAAPDRRVDPTAADRLWLSAVTEVTKQLGIPIETWDLEHTKAISSQPSAVSGSGLTAER